MELGIGIVRINSVDILIDRIILKRMNIFTSDLKVNRLLAVSYSSYLLLLLVVILDSLQASQHQLTALTLYTLPLLLLLPGLIQRHYRSYSWLCFLMLIYFTSYVVQVYSSTRGIYDWAGLTLSVILFVSAMYASRWLQRL